jgi:hypothetical protein
LRSTTTTEGRPAITTELKRVYRDYETEHFVKVAATMSRSPGASATAEPTTEVRGGTTCRRSAPLTEGHDAPSMWASDQEAMGATGANGSTPQATDRETRDEEERRAKSSLHGYRFGVSALDGSLDVIVRDDELGSSTTVSLLDADVEDGICSLRFGGILHVPAFQRPITVRKHLSFIAHAQKRALDDEVEVNVHGIDLVLRIGDVLLREPYSVWDAELANDERTYRAFALSDQLPPLAVASMMALGAASIHMFSGPNGDPENEVVAGEGSEARYQFDRAIADAGAPGPGQEWDWTLTDTAIASLEARLAIHANTEIQMSTVDVPDPLMLWSDMMASPEDEPDD